MSQLASKLESIRQQLGLAGPWEPRSGALWLALDSVGLRALAEAMNQAQARFVTITCYELPAGAGFRLEYHWDLDGQLLGFEFFAQDKSIDSIFDLCPAVDWIEREVHEEYAIDFAGRPYEPLLLKPGATIGVNLHEEVAK